MDLYVSAYLRLLYMFTGCLLMYRLTTAVFNLGGLGYSHHLHFGLHSRSRQACGSGQLATFHGSYPNQDRWQGFLGGVPS